MKIRSVRAEMFHAGGRTDGNYEANSRLSYFTKHTYKGQTNVMYTDTAEVRTTNNDHRLQGLGTTETYRSGMSERTTRYCGQIQDSRSTSHSPIFFLLAPCTYS
jgi:hypothetical protein